MQSFGYDNKLIEEVIKVVYRHNAKAAEKQKEGTIPLHRTRKKKHRGDEKSNEREVSMIE